MALQTKKPFKISEKPESKRAGRPRGAKNNPKPDENAVPEVDAVPARHRSNSNLKPREKGWTKEAAALARIQKENDRLEMLADSHGFQRLKNGSPWSTALRKAILQGDPLRLRKIADKLLDMALDGDMNAIRELSDRLDGKSVAQVVAQVDMDITVEIKQFALNEANDVVASY